MEVSSSGLEMAILAASSALPLPAARPTPMWAKTSASFMMEVTSAKSRLMKPVSRIRSEMDCTAWRSTSSAILEGVGKGDLLVGGVFQSARWDDDQRVHLHQQLRDALLGLAHRRLPSKAKGLVTTPTVRMPSLTGDLRHHGPRRCRCRRPYRR